LSNPNGRPIWPSLALTAAAAALLSPSLAVLPGLDLDDVPPLAAASAAAAAGVHLALVRLRGAAVAGRLRAAGRVLTRRRHADPGVADRFAYYLGTPGRRGASATSQRLYDIYRLRGGVDIDLLWLHHVIDLPERGWAARRPELRARVADTERGPWTRFMIARTAAQRDRDLGLALLELLLADLALDGDLRLSVADEIYRWDPVRGLAVYERLTDEATLAPETQVDACVHIGRTDPARAVALLLQRVADPDLPLGLRYHAAEETALFSQFGHVRALRILAHACDLELKDRVPAAGRLRQLGEPGAEELLRHGAGNLDVPPAVRELCMAYLARSTGPA